MSGKLYSIILLVAVNILLTACKSTVDSSTPATSSSSSQPTQVDETKRIFNAGDDSPELNPGENISGDSFSRGGRNPFDLQGEKIHHSFSPVYYAFNSSAVDKSNLRPLKILAKYINDNKDFHLVISGHTDEKGSEQYNRILSEKRALSVRQVLLSYYDIQSRIHTIGMGEERPANTADSVKAHAENRRAEFEIIAVSK